MGQFGLQCGVTRLSWCRSAGMRQWENPRRENLALGYNCGHGRGRNRWSVKVTASGPSQSPILLRRQPQVHTSLPLRYRVVQHLPIL